MGEHALGFSPNVPDDLFFRHAAFQACHKEHITDVRVLSRMLENADQHSLRKPNVNIERDRMRQRQDEPGGHASISGLDLKVDRNLVPVDVQKDPKIDANAIQIAVLFGVLET